jgi:hypothetical protein
MLPGGAITPSRRALALIEATPHPISFSAGERGFAELEAEHD